MNWKLLPLPDFRDKPEQFRAAVRLNSLGSLFFFARYTLKKERLSLLHRQMCASLEVEDLHLVLEEPMGHFKTTCGSVALPIWWALPFNDEDEFMMRHLGYDDTWIKSMYSLHNPNTRTLITHEIEQRAIDMGKEVNHAYEDNDLFRAIFPEILPDASCPWNDHSKLHKRDKSRPIDATTATYTYRGVGQALQGIHPDSIIQDDNFGKAAQDSMLRGDGRVVEDLIRWHRQLSTRLDNTRDGRVLGRQLVIGNRWGHADLNSWIRENQPHFKFETHDAEGGCCSLHPPGVPIFPEEWPMPALMQKRSDLGSYDYSHMYRNQSVLPEECIFKPEWLHIYKFKQSQPDLSVDDPRNILLLAHEPYKNSLGREIRFEDLQPGSLTKRMLVDLAHNKKVKRCDHCIMVVGYDPESTFIYILDLWAEATQYSDLVDMIYRTARRWQLAEFWLETVAAQNLLKFHIEERNEREDKLRQEGKRGHQSLRVQELPYDNSENAKKNRIEAIEPIARNGQIWVHDSNKKFIHQFTSYPSGLVDTLDTFGYIPKILDVGMSNKELMLFLRTQQADFESRQTTGAGGY